MKGREGRLQDQGSDRTLDGQAGRYGTSHGPAEEDDPVRSYAKAPKEIHRCHSVAEQTLFGRRSFTRPIPSIVQEEDGKVSFNKSPGQGRPVGNVPGVAMEEKDRR